MIIIATAGQTALIPLAMTVPLWGLIISILWTIAIVVLLITARIRHLVMGGNVKDFGIPNDESLLWRLFRVQANLVENLPLYLGVVLLLTLRGMTGMTIDLLVECYVFFRILHSIVHIAALNPIVRIVCLAVQLSCLVGLIALSLA
jgi:uncharacterized MAPEG superfamily protein